MLAKSMSYTFLHGSSRMYQLRKPKSQTKRAFGNKYKRHVIICSNEESNNQEEIKEEIVIEERKERVRIRSKSYYDANAEKEREKTIRVSSKKKRIV